MFLGHRWRGAATLRVVAPKSTTSSEVEQGVRGRGTASDLSIECRFETPIEGEAAPGACGGCSSNAGTNMASERSPWAIEDVLDGDAEDLLQFFEELPMPEEDETRGETTPDVEYVGGAAPVPGQGAVAPQGPPPEDPQSPGPTSPAGVPPSPPLLQGTAVPTPQSTTAQNASDDIAIGVRWMCGPCDVPKNYLDVKPGAWPALPTSTGPGAAIDQPTNTVNPSPTLNTPSLNTPHTIAKKERTVYHCHYPLCIYQSYRKFNVTRHFRTAHTSERPYKCSKSRSPFRSAMTSSFSHAQSCRSVLPVHLVGQRGSQASRAQAHRRAPRQVRLPRLLLRGPRLQQPQAPHAHGAQAAASRPNKFYISLNPASSFC